MFFKGQTGGNAFSSSGCGLFVWCGSAKRRWCMFSRLNIRRCQRSSTFWMAFSNVRFWLRHQKRQEYVCVVWVKYLCDPREVSWRKMHCGEGVWLGPLKGQQRTQFQEQKSSFYTLLSIETQRHEVNEWCCRGEGEFAPSDTSLVGIEEETDSITKIVASVSDHVSSTSASSPPPSPLLNLNTKSIYGQPILKLIFHSLNCSQTPSQ